MSELYVWVVTKFVPYEGDTVLAVFNSETSAVQYAIQNVHMASGGDELHVTRWLFGGGQTSQFVGSWWDGGHRIGAP